MIAIILAAGKGRRIASVHSCNSKCMLPVDGKPIIEKKIYQLSKCNAISKIFIIIRKDENEINTYFGSKYYGVEIEYCVQDNANKGIMNAVYSVPFLEKYKNEEIFLNLGDEYYGEICFNKLLKIHLEKKSFITPVLVYTDDVEKIKSNYTVKLSEKNEIIDAVEKPDHVFNSYIGCGTMVVAGNLINDFAEYYCGKMDDKNLIDWMKYAISNGKHVYAFKLDTIYCNLNSSNNLKYLYSLGYIETTDTIINMFSKIVNLYPERIAVVSNGKTITYKELDRKSNCIAYNLFTKKFVHGDCVAIMCGRSIEHIIVFMGILKAGGYYLPLDEKLPKSRIDYMIEKAQVQLVVSNCNFAQKLVLSCGIIEFEELVRDIKGEFTLTGFDCEKAYILFTSGTTGFPKGAVIRRSSIVNIVKAMKVCIIDKCQKGKSGKDEHLKIGVCASLSFDISVQQIYTSLLYGYTLYMVPADVKTRPVQLIDYLNRVDVCDITPLMISIVTRYLELHSKMNITTQHLVSGGEELKKNIIHKFFMQCPSVMVTNAYGPTECSVQSIMFYMNSEIEKQISQIPIGKPIRNTRIYILDCKNRIMPPGETGEICIAGDGVCLGYYKDVEKTSKVFQSDIIDSERKMYKTGDYGYLGIDGNIYYVGRIDNQVKFKGYRIELGEIEKVIEQYHNIDFCKVIIDVNEDVEQNMIAYIKINKTMIQLNKIYDFLHDRLPKYMIPQYFVVVDDFKLNNNDKLDRNALPDYRSNSLCIKENDSETRKDRYIEIKRIAEEMIKHPITITQSLITAGFDSIKLMYLIIKLEENYKKISVQEINLLSSIKDIAKGIEKNKSNVKSRHIKRQRVKGLPMQNYLLNLEDMLNNNKSIRYFNRLMFFVPCKEKLKFQKMRKAIELAIMNADAFKIKYQFNGSFARISESNILSAKINVYENVKRIENIVKAKTMGDIIYTDFLKLAEKFTEGFQAPLIEINYFKYKEHGLLAISVHHIVFDYLSFLYFMRNIEIFYHNPNAVRRGGSYYQFILDENKYLAGVELQKQRQFWNNIWNGVNEIDYYKRIVAYRENYKSKILEADLFYRNRQVSFSSDEKYRELLYQLDIKICILKKYSQEYLVSEFGIVLGAFLKILDNEKDLPVLVFAKGRERVHPIDTIGYFSSLLVFKRKEEKENDYKNYLQSVDENLNQVEKNRDGFVTNDYINKIPIFDYQKLCNIGIDKSNYIWERAFLFEDTIISNPIFFRLYNYGDRMELSVLFNQSIFDEKDILSFCMAYKEELLHILLGE